MIYHRKFFKLRAPFGVLQQLLGSPDDDDVPEKCSTCWSVPMPGMDGVHVDIQDWQDEDDSTFKLNVFRGLPSYDWDIWAADEATARKFCTWLSQRVIDKVREVKTLSPEGKAKLNELLRSGVSLADAIKQVPPESSDELARRFAWPIVD